MSRSGQQRPAGVSHPMVVRMLRRDMPRMQPSALKHEYLSSVANVLRNPVASEVEPDTGLTHVIGFGDVHRTLPLHLMVEPEPDSTVRHAFVPSPNEPRQRRLLEALQAHENQWAAEREARPRDIIGQIRHQGRGQVNRHGINHYEGRAPFNKADLDQIASGHWYPTAPLPQTLEVDHPGRPELHQGRDGAQIRANLSQSASMALGDPRHPGLGVHLDTEERNRLHLARLTIEPDSPVRPDQDPEGPDY